MKRVLRSRQDAVSPVVAEILLVAITVVLAAVVYLMASGLLSGTNNVPPVVAFSSVQPFAQGTYNSTFAVADASRSITMPNYRFALKVNLSVSNATNFAASGFAAKVTVNGVDFRVTWMDLDGGNTLSSGDSITVSGNLKSLPKSTSFDFVLLWTDGSALTNVAWVTP